MTLTHPPTVPGPTALTTVPQIPTSIALATIGGGVLVGVTAPIAGGVVWWRTRHDLVADGSERSALPMVLGILGIVGWIAAIGGAAGLGGRAWGRRILEVLLLATVAVSLIGLVHAPRPSLHSG